MNNIKYYIQEKLILNKTIKSYKYHPKDRYELRKILEKRLAKDKNANLNDIDVSKITDMAYLDKHTGYYGLFQNLDPHNINISEWDMSNCEDISYMFYNCRNFNCDLSKWNISKIEFMRFTFHMCENFEGKDLDNWNLENCNYNLNMNGIFNGCKSLKNIPRWYKK